MNSRAIAADLSSHRTRTNVRRAEQVADATSSSAPTTQSTTAVTVATANATTSAPAPGTMAPMPSEPTDSGVHTADLLRV